MKSKFLAVATVAAASFAVALPSAASAETVDADVACNKPATECARDLAVYGVNTAVNTINQAGPIIGNACREIFPSCSVPMP